MRRVFEFIAGNAFLAAIIGAMAGAFFVGYRGVVWLDLPDVPHALLAIAAVVLAVGAGVLVGRAGDRILNPRLPSPNRARARR